MVTSPIAFKHFSISHAWTRRERGFAYKCTHAYSEGGRVKHLDSFAYVNKVWSQSTSKDFEIRKACVRSACHKVDKIWKSERKRKIRFCINGRIFSIGCEAWTIDKTFSKRLDGCYSKMLRMAFDVSWVSYVKKPKPTTLWGLTTCIFEVDIQKNTVGRTLCQESRGRSTKTGKVDIGTGEAELSII